MTPEQVLQLTVRLHQSEEGVINVCCLTLPMQCGQNSQNSPNLSKFPSAQKIQQKNETSILV